MKNERVVPQFIWLGIRFSEGYVKPSISPVFYRGACCHRVRVVQRTDRRPSQQKIQNRTDSCREGATGSRVQAARTRCAGRWRLGVVSVNSRRPFLVIGGVGGGARATGLISSTRRIIPDSTPIRRRAGWDGPGRAAPRPGCRRPRSPRLSRTARSAGST